MDGIHDLGGRHGYGPVEVSGDEEPDFKAAWEARLFGIVRAMSGSKSWNLDKFRYTREQIAPVDYLQRPYYDQWYQSYAAMLLGAGLVSLEELATGKAVGRAPDGFGPPMRADDVAKANRHMVRFDRPAASPPAFAVGTSVVVRLSGPTGHTRMPQYVRGHCGSVVAYHGHHVLPDANAAGDERAEPLYTVVFRLADLFTEQRGSKDAVHLDLWESYLEPG